MGGAIGLIGGTERMQTPYDWITVAIFAGIVVLFLQRSVDDAPQNDSIWHYLPAGLGCALGNWLGNEAIKGKEGVFGQEGMHIPAILVIAGVLAYCWFVLKPFSKQ